MADGNITVEVSTQAAQAELERLRAENAALKHDLQYARDGLIRGRTRMREDNERLRAALAGSFSARHPRGPRLAAQACQTRSSRVSSDRVAVRDDCTAPGARVRPPAHAPHMRPRSECPPVFAS